MSAWGWDSPKDSPPGSSSGSRWSRCFVGAMCAASRQKQGPKRWLPPRRETSFRTLRVVGLLLLLLIVAGMAFGLGAIVAERGTYHRRYLEEKKLIAPVLAQDPAFVGIELRERSNGGVSITGRVPTREDKERLHAALLKAVGEVRAKEILYGISTPQLLEADN
jgi:hypothetical protein